MPYPIPAPTHNHPWHHGSKLFEQYNAKNRIEQLPDGRFVAFLGDSWPFLAGEAVHGPFVSQGDARLCCRGRCYCHKPREKADQDAARVLLLRSMS